MQIDDYKKEGSSEEMLVLEAGVGRRRGVRNNNGAVVVILVAMAW